MADCESQCKEIDRAFHPHKGKSANKLLNHLVSCPAKSSAMNSDFIVDLAMQVFFDDFHEIAPPHNVKTYPLVELTSSLSLT